MSSEAASKWKLLSPKMARAPAVRCHGGLAGRGENSEGRDAMTRFVIIEPAAHLLRTIDLGPFDHAVVNAGLNVDETDHGMIDRHTGVVVDQYGLLDPPERQDYFVINGHLYAGNAVIYGVDDEGSTVDVADADRLRPEFLHGRDEVERAISDGAVTRPELRVNGELIWKWPDQPAPRPGVKVP